MFSSHIGDGDVGREGFSWTGFAVSLPSDKELGLSTLNLGPVIVGFWCNIRRRSFARFRCGAPPFRPNTLGIQRPRRDGACESI